MTQHVCQGLSLILLLASAIAITEAAEPKCLPQDLLDGGWIQLFDGETLFGWKHVGDAQWKVADGEISSEGDKAGWLMTTTEWADFELHVEYKALAGTNSGIFVRSALDPTDPTKDCYELNIAPRENPFPTGSLVGRLKSPGPGAVWDGEWHEFDITMRGGNVLITCDGNRVLDYCDPSPIRCGHIGLQAKEGLIAFRNIRLSPLGLKSLFHGKDLTGWSLAGAELSKFDVTEAGELHLTNGPGQITSRDEFADFVLQLQCKVNGDGLNSGVFFRALPKGRWQGYESQINNCYLDADRSRPANFGTGGIYRRQPARRVVADDHQWFTKTIVADGPHFAVWVNGYQVSDWTDTRLAAENPREGLRLAVGAIAIQGHDPTSDFLFRTVRIVGLPE